MKNTFLILLLMLGISSYSQKENSIWHFGDGAGVDFSFSPPQGIGGASINSAEGCASVCDASGDLLFYTDGVSIWDDTHTKINSGNNLNGSSTSTQSALIVSKPGSSNRYYIFTNQRRLYYTEVQVSSGTVSIVGTANNALVNPCTEKLAATLHSNGTDIWVMTVDASGDFHSYLVSSTGVGSAVASTVTGSGGNHVGQMRFSQQGDKVAYVDRTSGGGTNEVFSFDNSTGKVTSTYYWNINGNVAYGLEFSPDGNYLFISHFSTVRQYDLSSKTVITPYLHTNTTLLSNASLHYAPNGNIYVANGYEGSGFGQYIDEIANPNSNPATYNDNAVKLSSGTYSIMGLQNLIVSPSCSTYATIDPLPYYCAGDPVDTLTATPPGGTWSGTGITNASLGIFDPNLVTGTDTITYTPDSCGYPTKVIVSVNATPVSIDPVPTFCITDAAYNLTATPTGGTWSGTGITHATNGTFNPATAGSGTHTIIYSGGCITDDTVYITVNALTPSSITPPPVFCSSDPVYQLMATPAGGTWSGTGITDPVNGTFDPSIAGGSVTITYSGGNCMASSNVNITVNALTSSSITPVSPLDCTDPIQTLSASPSGGTWSGNGIIDPVNGLFDPRLARGSNVITYSGGTCMASSTTTIVVNNGYPTQIVLPSDNDMWTRAVTVGSDDDWVYSASRYTTFPGGFPDYGTRLVAMDECGNIMWQQNIKEFWASDIIVSQNRMIYMTGIEANPFLSNPAWMTVETDGAGNVTNSTTHQADYEGRFIDFDANEKFLFVAGDRLDITGTAKLHKLDINSLGIVNTRTVTGWGPAVKNASELYFSYINNGNVILERLDQSLGLITSANDPTSHSGNILAMDIDSQDNIAILQDGGEIFYYDVSLSLIWQKALTFDHMAGSLIFNSGDEVVAIGASGTNLGIQKIDALGSTVWNHNKTFSAVGVGSLGDFRVMDLTQFNHSSTYLPIIYNDTWQPWVRLAGDYGSYGAMKRAGENEDGEMEVLTDIQIHPNPSTGKFEIMNLQKGSTVHVHDLQGRLVHSFKYNGDGNPHIDLSAEPGGLYLLQIQDNSSLTTVKLQKL